MWRVTKRVLLVLAIWYGLVLLSKLVCPRISDGSPAMPTMVLSSLYAHQRCAEDGVESFGDVTGSETLRRVARSRRSGGYLLQTFPTEAGTIDAVIAYPRHDTQYRYNIAWRVLVLDFYHYHLHTYLLTRDGAFYEAAGFSDSRPPTAADVALRDLPGSGNPWSSRGPLPVMIPPTTPARPGSTNPASRGAAGGQP